eukprot:scaffold102104_cov24-Tisochrysis_lutea.AAC.1
MHKQGLGAAVPASRRPWTDLAGACPRHLAAPARCQQQQQWHPVSAPAAAAAAGVLACVSGALTLTGACSGFSSGMWEWCSRGSLNLQGGQTCGPCATAEFIRACLCLVLVVSRLSRQR